MPFDIERIRAAVDIVDLIGRDEPLQKHADSFRSGHESAGHGSQSGTCLDVSPRKQVYFCRSCLEQGDIFAWVMNRNRCGFIEAAKWICETYRLPFEDVSPEALKQLEMERQERARVRDIMKECFQFYHDSMTDTHRDYFRGRGISDESMNSLLLGYAPSGNALAQAMRGKYSAGDLYKTGLFFKNETATDRYKDRFIFPYWKRGEVVFSIGRSIDPKIEAHKKYVKHLVHKEGQEYISAIAVDHCIWGVDTVRGATEIIITEGIVDAILTHQNKIPVLSPITTQFSNRDIERLVELTRNAETIYLINDSEQSGAGLKGAKKTAQALFEAGQDARIIELPRPSNRDKYDLADFWGDYTAETLKELMADAPDYVEFLIDGVAQIPAGKKREKALKEVLGKIAAEVEPLAVDRYLETIASMGIAKLGTLRRQLKLENGNGATSEKTAIQLADELVAERYTYTKEWTSGRVDEWTGEGEEDLPANTPTRLHAHTPTHTLVFQHGTWYEWNGTKYEARSKDEYETEVIRKIRNEPDKDVSPHFVNAVRMATQPLVIIPDSVEAPYWKSTQGHAENIISLKNGLFDLDSFMGGKPSLKPHTPDFFVLSSQPYDFLPNAGCPRWHQFLEESLQDITLRAVLGEFFGLCLTHDQRFHKFLFLQGKSRTGKGVAFTILQDLVGKDNVSNVALRDFGQPFGLQPMLGKKLNISAEVPELDKVAEDVIKEYTGGDTVINYNRKNQTPIITSQRARLAFSSNNYPTFRDRTEGLWNRMLLIPFNNVVIKEDLNLVAELRQELSGIFNWAVAGYQRLVEQDGFTESFTIDAEIQGYKQETIPAHQFTDTYLNFEYNGRAVHSKTLYRYYVLWSKCEGRGVQSAVTFGRDISTYLKSLEIEPIRDMYGTYFPGAWIDEAQREWIISRAKAMTILRDDYHWEATEDEKYDRPNLHEDMEAL